MEESQITRRALAALKEHFPAHARVIEQLAEESETFSQICADFLTCGETIRRFEKQGDVAKSRIEEYSDMQKELEQELLGYLEGKSTHAGRRSERRVKREEIT